MEFAGSGTETLPVLLATVLGAKVMVYVRLCPPFNVSGALIPLMLNPAPVAVACEIAMGELLVLVKTSVFDCVEPARTLPNATLDGLPTSAPGTAAGAELEEAF